jgi:hypothetical protein
VVVEAVDDPGRLARGEQDLGRVDLPEVIRQLALETLRRLAPAGRVWADQVVALERTVDRCHRRRQIPARASSAWIRRAPQRG